MIFYKSETKIKICRNNLVLSVWYVKRVNFMWSVTKNLISVHTRCGSGVSQDSRYFWVHGKTIVVGGEGSDLSVISER